MVRMVEKSGALACSDLVFFGNYVILRVQFLFTQVLARMVEKREAPAKCDDVILKIRFSPSRVLVEKRGASACYRSR
jgi:hypothetical protein